VKKIGIGLMSLVLVSPLFWQFHLMSLADRQDLPQQATYLYWKNLLSGERYSVIDDRTLLLRTSFLKKVPLDGTSEFERFGSGIVSKMHGTGDSEMFTRQYEVLTCSTPEFCIEFLRYASH
jgi:hypothetical protein